MIMSYVSRAALGAALFGFAVSYPAAGVRAFGFVGPGETIEFSLPDDARSSETCTTIVTSCSAQSDLAEGKAAVVTAIFLGVLEAISAETTLFATFNVTEGSGAGRVIDARVSGQVRLEGLLTAGGVAGAASEITVTATLFDVTANVAVGSAQVFGDDCAGEFLTACTRPVSTTRTVSFGAKVTRGHAYELRLRAQCESQSGLVAADTICAFGPSDLKPNAFVQWQNFSITVDDDLIGLINDLQRSVDLLSARLAAHDADVQAKLADILVTVEENQWIGLENVRLNNTPLGRRASEFEACDGKPCDFPSK